MVRISKRRWCVVTEADRHQPQKLILYEKAPEMGVTPTSPLHTLDATGIRVEASRSDTDPTLKLTFRHGADDPRGGPLVLTLEAATLSERHLWEAALSQPPPCMNLPSLVRPSVAPEGPDGTERISVRRLCTPPTHRAMDSLAALDLKRRECAYNSALHRQQVVAQAQVFAKDGGVTSAPVSPSVLVRRGQGGGTSHLSDWGLEYQQMMEQRNRLNAVCAMESHFQSV